MAKFEFATLRFNEKDDSVEAVFLKLFSFEIPKKAF